MYLSVCCFNAPQGALLCPAALDHGSGKVNMQATAVKVFNLCKAMHASLHVSWVPRAQNTEADSYSKSADSLCRSLNPLWFRVLDRKVGWGPFTIDRFADHANRQRGAGGPLPFNSLYACPGCAGVDAFTQEWGEGSVNWCHPPARLVGRVWRFMQEQAVQRAVLLLPVWPSAVWWPLVIPMQGFFFPAVVGVFPLPHEQHDFFLPGVCDREGGGARNWRVWALNLSFAAGWDGRAPLPCPL